MRKNVAKALERLGWVGSTTADILVYADEYLQGGAFTEGKPVSVLVNRYERSRKAREACIRHHKALCCVCEFDFAVAYGTLGSGFIHVHHLKPLSEAAEEYVLDPVNDLCPVCPNCHAMLHIRGHSKPPFTIEELKAVIRKG
ncbi:MAG: HNH endonuclease [Verrucomicrobia bacterium]|nr:HNH endonuclease [Verrucomicrobiota bacterium]